MRGSITQEDQTLGALIDERLGVHLRPVSVHRGKGRRAESRRCYTRWTGYCLQIAQRSDYYAKPRCPSRHPSTGRQAQPDRRGEP